MDRQYWRDLAIGSLLYIVCVVAGAALGGLTGIVVGQVMFAAGVFILAWRNSR